MASTPNYVRLAPRLTRGMIADVENSGWTIAGLDVRKVPDKSKNPAAHKFIRKALADGRLEGASQAEWDEVHDTEEVEGEALTGRPRATALNSQEAHIQRAAQEGSRRIVESRLASSDSEGSDDDEDDGEDDGLDELSKAQLVDRANSLGIDAGGNKDAIKQRIRAFVNDEDDDDSEDDGSE